MRSAGAEVIVFSGVSKVFEPTPRWMRIFARTHLQEPVRALDKIDLVVREGEICAVVGPNGAGKTTMFRILVGLTTATSGTATVQGLDVERDAEQVRQVIGWMPSEDRSLLMRATAKENLQMHGRLQGMPRALLRERIPYVLEAVNLIPQMNAVAGGLSAGMRARLRLARALLPSPRALVLDEPTGAVDPIAAHGLLELITGLVESERLAVLISSHRLEEIEALQSRALLMDRGTVKYSGNLDHLRRELDRPSLELVMVGDHAAVSAEHALKLIDVPVTRDGAVIDCPGFTRSVGEILTALGPITADIVHIRETPMPMRDLIARVYELNDHVKEPVS